MRCLPALAWWLSVALIAALLIGCQREVADSGPMAGDTGPRAVRVELGPLPDGRIAPAQAVGQPPDAERERNEPTAGEAADGRAAGDRHAADRADQEGAPPRIGPEHRAAAQRLPFIEVDFERRHIDLEGYVSLTEGLLELIATIRAGKEHESVFAVHARPRHIHLALLMLGLEPGEPGRWIYEEDEVRAIDPTGDRVALSVLYEGEGEVVEKPVSAFVRDHEAGEPLPGDEFVFAGSAMGETFEGEPHYLADGSGDVISLVSFGDELLAWPTAASHLEAEEALAWEANTPEIPELNTPVVIRIRPADDPDEEPAQRGAADDERQGRGERRSENGTR